MSSGKQPARDDLPMGQNSSGEQARLEEAIRQLSIDGGSRPYPQRFNEPDCIFYLRNGFCVYGPRCPFNHPPNPILAMEARRAAAREYPQREGQSVCQYYMRTGMCSFGATCKYHHPRQRGESPGMVIPNIYGYPLRPNEKECLHYMRTGQCKFGMTCKFHHPQPTNAQVPASAAVPFPLAEVVLPPLTYPALQSPSVDLAEQYGTITGNWSVVRPTVLPGSYFPGTSGRMLFPPGMIHMPDWTPYPDFASSVPYQATRFAAGPNPIYHRTQLSASAPAYTGPHMSVIASIGASSSTQNESAFPQRPGQPECHHYMKYGDCKFGSSCKYHHPAEWGGTNADLASAMGLPHDLSVHLSILFLPCPSNPHSERARKYSISIMLLVQVCSIGYQFTASISTTTTTHPGKSHKCSLGRVNVRRPYHYLIEIESLITGMEARRATPGEYPDREGQYVCQYYMRTWMFKFGASCKYHHPRQRGESPSFKFKQSCSTRTRTKPADAQGPASAAAPFPLPKAFLPPTTYPAVQSPSVDLAEQYGTIAGNWSVVKPTLLPGSYFPITYWSYAISSWNGSHAAPCPDSASSVPSQATWSAAGPNPIYRRTQLFASALAYTGPHMSVIASIGASSSTQNESAFPQRPGQPKCHHHMKYGDCKFGSSCKYHHPAEWGGTNADLASAMGLPHDLSLHLSILFLPCPNNLHSWRVRKYSIKYHTASVSTTTYPVKFHNSDLRGENVHRPYHYLIEMESLITGYGSKKSSYRRIPLERGSICLPGMCKFGASCKYHHQRQGGESPSLVMPNIHGYLLRPNEKDCSHNMKTGQCKFGMTCKFHHPQRVDAQVPASAAAPFPVPEAVLPPTTHLAVQSPSVDSAEQYGMIAGNWSVLRPTLLPSSYFPSAYGPMIFPPGMVPALDWTPYPDSASPVPSQTTQSTGLNPVYHRTQLFASVPAYTGPHMSIIASVGVSSNTQNESAFPQRPGQPECHYYMKCGDCKFGSSCKCHHPAEWSAQTQILSLVLWVILLTCKQLAI